MRIASNPACRAIVGITPMQARWRYLSFWVIQLQVGEGYDLLLGQQEAALVPLEGKGLARVGNQNFQLQRSNVFQELPHVLYIPPQCHLRVSAITALTFAIGCAPATGMFPLRLFAPAEMRIELRGGGPAWRQVNHILGPDLPAERLILYEVYTPSGFWSGWPPHRHDGRLGSPYFEEIYYYRIQPVTAQAIHWNYDPEEGCEAFFAVHDGDLVLVRQGYHPVAAPPGANVYYLNYLAGDPRGAERALPPVDDPTWAWIRKDWSGNPLILPIGGV
ncbi:5-deoxy-glucuronate isomerase [Thermorudis peleae]|uniref:5-deoxy-glucuronate isomerase n=1 Tax=Thermorudis peleae TaxID=1382356 RepID=UPI00056E234A|nr:5-deoxy-glucuronate isomerase [Thermorudis peleae]